MRAVTAVLLAVLLCAAGAHAQTRTVEILNADLVTVQSDSGGVVRQLDGNVRLRQDTTLLSARSAVYDEARNEVALRGGVRIVSGRDTLTAEEVLYRSDTRVAEARDRVRVGDGESVLLAPQATYDTGAEVSTFSGGGRILHRGAVITSPAGEYSSGTRVARLSGPVRLVDSTDVLTAARGTYDARIQRADFAGLVRLRRPDTRLAADSVVYFRRTERARAYGRVALERVGEERTGRRAGGAPADSSRRTFLFGEQVLYDGQAETAGARGESRAGRSPRDPLLVTLRGRDDGGVDTTLVRAPRLDALQVVAGADTLQTLVAWGGARLYDGRLAAVADSARLVRSAPRDGPSVDRLGLFSRARPSAWADGAQLTGDTLSVVSRAERVDSVLVVGRAFAARVDSTVGRVQQLAGGRMLAVFEGDSLRRLSVWPTAEAVTYRADAAGLLAGADRLSADSLVVAFRDGAIREVRGYGGIAGTAYGPRIVPDGVRLPGFAFEPDAAPTRAAVLDPDGWEADFLRDFGPPAEALRPPPEGTGGG
ncbi:MAG TPA: OstA-like protein [Rubricoccaceae bacterium]|jgi:lipopolysaccharide export system protein LptA